MKNFKYYIVKFIPDKVSQEQVNVAIISYSKDDQLLKFKTVQDFNRISNFFYGLNLQNLFNILDSIQARIKDLDFKLCNDDFFDFELFVKNIVPENDSMISLSKQFIGITENFETSFQELFRTYISKYEVNVSEINELILYSDFEGQLIFARGFRLKAPKVSQKITHATQLKFISVEGNLLESFKVQ